MDLEQMAVRCPESQLVGAAVVQDYKLLFKGSKTGAYATIENKIGGQVPVLIWKITPVDEERLDRYEGYPVFYYKRQLEIELNGSIIKAMVYIMNEKRKYGLPSRQYFERIQMAYRKFEFNQDTLLQGILDSSYGTENIPIYYRWDIIQFLKRSYPHGTRVELIVMNDPYRSMHARERGTVQSVDDIGTIHVKWDNGATLGVVMGVDQCRIID